MQSVINSRFKACNVYALLLMSLLVTLLFAYSVKVSVGQVEEPEPTQWVDPDGKEPSPKPPTPPISLEAPASVYEPRIHGRPYVIVLVNNRLYPNVADEINRYVGDLDAEDLDAHVITLNATIHPSTIRSIINTEYNKGATGCLLVGDFLQAWYEMSNPSPWGNEQFPTDLYYMDLNGLWNDTDGDGLFDQHSGDQEPEIWVGRLKASNMDVDEVSLIKNYFEKNHAYRTGALSLPKRALIYIDDDWVGSASSIEAAVGTVFSNRTLVTDPYTTTSSDYLARLQQDYSLVHVMVHGSSFSHCFKNGGWDGVVRSGDIRSVDPNAFFYVLFSCSNARFIERNYIAGWYVFSNTYGLAAVSSTKTGAILGDYYFYSNFLGHNLGYAFKSWLVQALGWGSNFDKWFYGMTIIGDPTLTLFPSHYRRDVATLGVRPLASQVIPGTPFRINVTAANQGQVPEIANVHCFCTTKRKPVSGGTWLIVMTWIEIGQQKVFLAPSGIATIQIIWDTSGLEAGWYYDISTRTDLSKTSYDMDSGDNFYYLDGYTHPTPTPILLVFSGAVVNILVTSPGGSRVGYDYAIGQVINEIPGASYSGPEANPEVVTIPSPSLGAYEIDIVGTGDAVYSINVESTTGDGSPTDVMSWNSTISLSEIHESRVVLFSDRSLRAPGDSNGDRMINASDLRDLNKAYGSDSSERIWNPKCDFNADDKVAVSDLYALGKNFGKSHP